MSLEGSVALITGAARGQGRSHALALASRQDLDETVAMVASAGGTMLAAVADVRSLEQLEAAVAPVLSELGRLDIVVANAGITPVGGAAASSLRARSPGSPGSGAGRQPAARPTAPASTPWWA